MWTEREKTLTDKQEIAEYVKEMRNFHDYIITQILYDGTHLGFFVEEDKHSKDNDGAYSWDFHFDCVSKFEFNIDAFFKMYIIDLYVNDEVTIELETGMITIKAENMTLGIPSKK